jgi:hypothetical protein
MTREIQSLFSLNRGIVSKLGLARMDVKRLSLAAEMQTNWMPRVLGSMSVRPGTQYIGGIRNNAAARFLKFIFATDDTALLELTDSVMRIWMSDTLLTRPAVSTVVVNGSFTVDPAAAWDGGSLSDAGGTVSWGSTQYLQLASNGTARAIAEQEITVAVADRGIEHGIRISIVAGPVSLRIGSTSGDDDYLSETILNAGTHSISIVPTGNFFVRFFSVKSYVVWVGECEIEGAGVVELPTPWTSTDLDKVRYDQSGDVLFVACKDIQQRRIERRGERPNGRSWSVAYYMTVDGPFKLDNVTKTTLTPNALSGNVVVTASVPLFKTSHVGSLFSITSSGQNVSTTTGVGGTATTAIRITGVDAERVFAVDVTGIITAGTVVDLQRSFDNTTWNNTAGNTFTSDTSKSEDDSLNNQIVWYRLILTSVAGGDTPTMAMHYSGGSIRGVVRITGFTDSLNVGACVLSDLGNTTASAIWQEGHWSDVTGWPTAVRLHEGRLWWSGINGVWGSVSDAFESFDELYVGSAGPINRTIGSGPVDTINWLLSLKGLAIGAQGAEYTARASSLDEPLTPTNFNLKCSSNQGSGDVEAVKVDQSGVFVDRSGIKVYETSFDVRNYEYVPHDLTELAPELGVPGIVRMDTQRRPDTRIHCVRADGAVIIAVSNKGEEVLAWWQFETDGVVEDVVTLPSISGNVDDQVYYVVNRTINGTAARYLEKWAQETDCRGASITKLADSFIISTGSVITGLGHLEGKEVVVWANGMDVGTASDGSLIYTVDAGQITLARGYQNVLVGLGYTAQFMSARLGGQQGASLNMQKRSAKLGLISAYMHPQGLKFGADFDHLDDLPAVEQGAYIVSGIHDTYDENTFEFPGLWTTDLRLCIQGQAPRPATVLALTMDLVVNT